MPQPKIVTLYLPNGSTVQFNEVTNLKEHRPTNQISFDYVSVVSGRKNNAAFDMDGIIGITTTIMEDNDES